MKKLFALVLSTAMVMSMSAVAFAAASEKPNADGVTGFGTVALKYDGDLDTMTAIETFQYGKTVYFPLLMDTNNDLVKLSEMADGLKIKVEYEMGKDLVTSVGLVKKYVAGVNAKGNVTIPTNAKDKTEKVTLGDAKSNYYYFIEMKLAAKETTSDADIAATIELDKSKKGDDDAKNYKVKDLKDDISFNVGYEKNYNMKTKEYMVDDDEVGEGVLKPETYYLLKYDYDEEVDFTFGKDPNEGTFTVDVSGQGKNLLWFDTKLDDAIVAANPTAKKLYALNFNDTKFNRTGEFLYEADDFEYAYEVKADGSLKLLGEFDGGEITFKTRILGKYLFSDVELVAAPAEVAEVPAVDAPVVDPANPTTGGPNA